MSSSDGATVEMRVFAPELDGASAVGHALMWMPAMGVPARAYDRFAKELAQLGVGVAVGDHRGTGSSSVQPRRNTDFGYADMLERDWPPLLAAARKRFGSAKLHLGGHSLGGQLAAIYAGRATNEVASLALVAAGSVYWRGWTGSAGLRVLGGTQLAMVIAQVLGFFPGDRLGFGGRQPREVIIDWARIARTGRFSLREATFDGDAALAQVSTPVHAVNVEGDTFAPLAASQGLTAKMPSAKVVHSSVSAPNQPTRLDPHFRWMREPAPVAAVVRERLLLA